MSAREQHDAGTVYLIHLDEPYKHARHYLGSSGSSAILKGGAG
jgi:hypothetical protein